GSHAYGATLNEDGSRLYIAQGTGGSAISSTEGHIVVIDTADNSIVKTISTGAFVPLIVSATPDGRYVYANSYNAFSPDLTNSIVVVDTIPNDVTPIDIDGPADDTWKATSVEVSPDGDRVYVVANKFDTDQGKVLVVDTDTNTIVDQFDVGTRAKYVAF